MTQLAKKDISLTHSMIPLGSCTMKLNAVSELLPLSWPEVNSLHPFVPKSQAKGYTQMLEELTHNLKLVTKYDAISYHSQSGA